MLLWRPVEPVDTSFARCWLRSPPEELEPSPCPKCILGATYRESYPLEVEWEAGSDRIGDFACWAGRTRVALKRSAYEQLRERWPHLRCGAVEMVQDRKLKRPVRARKGQPRVWLPYEGPELVELLVDQTVDELPAKTTREEFQRCDVCGRTSRLLIGVEAKEQRWDRTLRRLATVHFPREEGKGLFVRASDLKGADLFRLNEGESGIVLCTDDAKRFIEGTGLTNVDFLLYGEICP